MPHPQGLSVSAGGAVRPTRPILAPNRRGGRPGGCREPWQSTDMEESRFLQCLAADYGDLRDAASAAELTATVPSCPGWTVSDLVRHVAEVYLHKVTLMRT